MQADELDHQERGPGEQYDDQGGDDGLGARQPQHPPPRAAVLGLGHFATTAQIAITLDTRQITTGTISWYRRACRSVSRRFASSRW